MHQMPPYRFSNQRHVIPQCEVSIAESFLHCFRPEPIQGRYKNQHRVEPQTGIKAEDLLAVHAEGEARDDQKRYVQVFVEAERKDTVEKVKRLYGS